MGFVLFIFSLISVLLTYNVLRPLYHHPKWIVPSFLLGWLTGELALHVVAFQLLCIFLFAWGGMIEGFWGALSLVACAVSWMLLAYHYYSGYKAKILMDSIVAPHETKGAVCVWGRHSEMDLDRLIFPFSDWREDQVELIKDIVYKEVDGIRLKLDIRRSRALSLKGKQTGAPVLLQIHGGAWTFGYGSKNEQAVPLMTEMARRGWISVSINYRLSPKATFPDHIIDCKSALVWVKAHIAEYGGDPNFIVVTGGSAGGHLSSLLALTPDLPEFQPGFESEDTRVQGCVPFYGIYDLLDSQKLQNSPGIEIVMRKSIIKQTKAENPDLYRLMSPISHIHADAPPFLVIHGDKDSLTSLGEAQYFASELDEVSKQTVDFAEIPGGQHAFDVFSSLRSEYVMLGVAERIAQWHRDFKRQQ
jgi:acetyl esterase/lipase